jgi:acyl-CoA synthetase (AMP-forming)/AMP-acid ligase II
MSSTLHPSVKNLISLTLPELVEYRLCHNSDDTFVLFPGHSVGDEPSRITYLEFGRAVQRFARAVQSDYNLKSGDVVGVIANCDALLYITAIVGLLHNGVTVGFILTVESNDIDAHMDRCSRCPLETLEQLSTACFGRLTHIR